VSFPSGSGGTPPPPEILGVFDDIVLQISIQEYSKLKTIHYIYLYFTKNGSIQEKEKNLSK